MAKETDAALPMVVIQAYVDAGEKLETPLFDCQACGYGLPRSFTRCPLCSGQVGHGAYSRQETCSSVTSGSIPTVPFVFTTSDAPYTRLACGSGCALRVPAVANRYNLHQSLLFQLGGIQSRCDTLAPVIVAPAAYMTAGPSATPPVSVSVCRCRGWFTESPHRARM